MSASYLDSTPDRSQAICDLPFCRAPPDRLARSRARARPILRTHTHAHVVTKHSVKMAAIMNISAAAKVCKAPKVRFERAPARRFPGRIDRDASLAGNAPGSVLSGSPPDASPGTRVRRRGDRARPERRDAASPREPRASTARSRTASTRRTSRHSASPAPTRLTLFLPTLLLVGRYD